MPSKTHKSSPRPAWAWLPLALLISLPMPVLADDRASPTDSERSSALESVRSGGSLRFITIPEQISPFMSIDLDAETDDARKPLKGVDYELLRLFADRLGATPELVLPKEPNLVSLWHSLENGDAHVAAGGLSIIPSRLERFDFSDPYYRTQLAIISRKDGRWQSLEQVRSLTTAVCRGSSAAEHWQRLSESSGELHWADFTIEALAAVSEGSADIAVEDAAFVHQGMKNLPDLKIAFLVPIDDHYGIAFQKGSDLLPAFNAFLKEIEHSGELDRILSRHIESTQ